jgi:2-keto-4-pentenoate hydratase/2-oxohepta-3-ene-1,7-dioic acid hydratase in catechol pathway
MHPALPNNLTVRTVYCIGRNYAAHARELNNPVPGEPVVFIKPASSVVPDGASIVIPAQSNDVHYEAELVLSIGKQGKNIPIEEAMSYVAGYGLGIDVTARDLQQIAKEKSLPWSVAKGFDTFAPLSEFVDVASLPDPDAIEYTLDINGERRQHGMTSHMLFPIPFLVHYLSGIFTLYPGDIIFTGTPEGVGKLNPGDRLHAILNGTDLTLTVDVV